MRISDWSSDVCSSDLAPARAFRAEASFPVARAGYDDERVAELLRTRGRGPIDHRSGGARPAIPSPPLSRDGRDHAWLRAHLYLSSRARRSQDATDRYVSLHSLRTPLARLGSVLPPCARPAHARFPRRPHQRPTPPA